MKRTALRSARTLPLPRIWREAEYAALRADAADSYDDRVSQNMFDPDDERAEIDNVVHGMIGDAH